MNLHAFRIPYYVSRFRLFAALLFVAMLCAKPCVAQNTRQHTSNLNTWLMYNGDHRFAPKWGVHLEAQIRRNEGLAKWQQLLFRTALNYHVSASLFVSAGYAFIQSYPYGDFPVKTAFPEHRIWEQLQLKNQIGKIEHITRLRVEQRFSKLPVARPFSNVFAPGDAVYTNRFRLMHRISIPFKGKVIADRSFYISAYDEIYINAGKNAGTNIFDQNRLYLALGYRIPRLGRLEAGYLEQTLIKGDGVKIENNHTLQLGLSSNIDFMRRVKTPG